MVMVALSGLITGVLISAPLGPMAALASLEVSRKRWASALAVAGGVCLGDTVLAALMLVVLRTPLEIGLPTWLPYVGGACVLLVLAAVIWKDADKPVLPAASQSFGRAVIATLAHPGNIIGFAALYAAVLRVLDARAVADLSLAENIGLLTATVAGMLLGWLLVLGGVHLAVRRFGQIPKRWQTFMSRGIAVIMMLSAFMLLVEYRK